MQTNFFSTFVILTTLAWSIPANANILTNGGLEVTPQQLQNDPTLLSPDNLVHSSDAIHPNALTGWTVGGISIDIVPATYWQSAQGSYCVDLIGTPGIGSISQTVSGLTPGTSYQLTFDFAINPDAYDNEQDSTKILQVTATNTDLVPTLFSGTAGTATIQNMEWAAEAVTFTANAGNITLTMAALMPAGLSGIFTPSTVFCGPVIDNLDLEPTSGNPQSPEPATAATLLVGTLLFLCRRHDRAYR